MIDFLLNLPIYFYILTAWALLSIIMITAISISDHYTEKRDDDKLSQTKINNQEEKEHGIKSI